MNSLPRVVRAVHDEGHRIHLTFSDGTEGLVDFESWLSGPVFEPLKDVQYFERFFLDGGTVAWPNGADIAPETLYEAALATQSDTYQPSPRQARRSSPSGRARKPKHHR